MRNKTLLKVLGFVVLGIVVVYCSGWLSVIVRVKSIHWWYQHPERSLLISCMPLLFLSVYGYVVGHYLFKVWKRKRKNSCHTS